MSRRLPMLVAMLVPMALVPATAGASDLARTRAAAARFDRAAAAARVEAVRIADDRARLDGAMVTTRRQLQATAARLDTIAAGRRAAEASFAAQRAPVARLLALLERLARRPAMLALARPDSLADTRQARAALAAIDREIARQTAILSRNFAAIEAMRHQALAAQRLALAEQRRLKVRLEALASASDAAERASAAASDQAGIARQRILGLTERTAQVTALIARRESERRLNAHLAALPGPTLHAAMARTHSPAVYRIAVPGRVVSGTGEASAAGVRQRGLTIAPAPAALVVAPAAGRVLYAGSFGVYGSIVILDHGRDWSSVIAGLAGLAVRPGTRLASGAPLGHAPGHDPRIGIELRHHGRPVDVAAVAARLGG